MPCVCELAKLFFQRNYIILVFALPPAIRERSNCFICSTTLAIVSPLILAILVGVLWYLHLVLICIFFVTSDKFILCTHSLYLLTISISFCMCEVSVQVSCLVLIELFILLLLNCKSSLNILGIGHLSYKCNLKIFSEVYALFHFLKLPS